MDKRWFLRGPQSFLSGCAVRVGGVRGFLAIREWIGAEIPIRPFGKLDKNVDSWASSRKTESESPSGERGFRAQESVY